MRVRRTAGVGSWQSLMRSPFVGAMLPFSKFDPNRPVEDSPEAKTPSGARRILILRWVVWIVYAYTALGFGFIMYWLFR